jgi:hypothetical protein
MKVVPDGWLEREFRNNRLEIAKWPKWKREAFGIPEPNFADYDVCPCCRTILGFKDGKHAGGEECERL